MIIGFVNQKGGVGKTTLSINLASYLAKKFKVVAIDTDPQSSLSNFVENAKEINFDSEQVFLNSLGNKIKELKEKNNYDYFIVDTQGSANPSLIKNISMFDKIIIPIQPSKIDVDSSLDLIPFIKNLCYKYLINNASHMDKNSVDNLKKTLCNNHISYYNNIICSRKVYREAYLKNETIFESKNQRAIDEFIKFVEEMKNE